MKFSKRTLGLGPLIFLTALTLWLFSSNFILSRELDYDAYRYLFHAVSGDSSSQLGGNYRIVDYLRFAGVLGFGYYLPHLVVGFLCFQALLGCSMMPKITFSVLYALMILALLLVQTGKDGFLALMLTSLIVWTPSGNHKQQTRRLLFYKIFSVSTLLFVTWLRIQSVAYALLGFTVVRYGWKKSCVVAIFLVLSFYILGGDFIDSLDAQVVGFMGESNIPSSMFGINLTGLGLNSYFARLFIYLSSIVVLPLVYLTRSVSGQLVPLHVFCIYFVSLMLLITLCRSPVAAYNFATFGVPFCIFLATSPIIHFRYLLPVIPFMVIASCLRPAVRPRSKPLISKSKVFPSVIESG